jgi:hypothetical protein
LKIFKIKLNVFYSNFKNVDERKKLEAITFIAIILVSLIDLNTIQCICVLKEIEYRWHEKRGLVWEKTDILRMCITQIISNTKHMFQMSTFSQTSCQLNNRKNLKAYKTNRSLLNIFTNLNIGSILVDLRKRLIWVKLMNIWYFRKWNYCKWLNTRIWLTRDLSNKCEL